MIRRITNKTSKQFVADAIAGPLGADYQIGAAEEDWDRIAPVGADHPGIIGSPRSEAYVRAVYEAVG